MALVAGVLTATPTSVLCGPLVGGAAGLLAATVTPLIRADRRDAARRRARVDLMACVRTLARELRAGAPPAVAVRAAGSAHPGAGRSVMDRLGAVIVVDRPAAAGTAAAADRRKTAGGVAEEVVARLTAGWALSARHGVPWATLIDALALDLAEQVRAEAARTAQVAGPRLSGYLLSVMPALGVLLGTGMGARPVHVLLETPTGGLLLLIGVGLTCAGLGWAARIVRP